MYLKIYHSEYSWMFLYTSLSALIIKPKKWTLSVCVTYTQHFPTNIYLHKNHTKRVWAGETEYFCPVFSILLFGFLLVYVLHLLNIYRELIICQTLCYTYLYSKMVFLPKRRHSLWDWIPTRHEPQAHEWTLDNPEIFWDHDMTVILWPDLNKDLLWEVSSAGKCYSLKLFTVMRLNGQNTTVMPFRKDCVLVQVENGF